MIQFLIRQFGSRLSYLAAMLWNVTDRMEDLPVLLRIPQSPLISSIMHTCIRSIARKMHWSFYHNSSTLFSYSPYLDTCVLLCPSPENYTRTNTGIATSLAFEQLFSLNYEITWPDSICRVSVP